MRRGEVWWGTGPGKRRPYVILTRDAAVPLLSAVVVAPATTKGRDIPTEVVLDRSDGMPERCVLSLDNVITLPKRALRRRITTLKPSKLDEVCEAIEYALGCGH